jgi:adenosylcobinamide kinase/adenosylcobinamide-phosphate guanylyltransferase
VRQISFVIGGCRSGKSGYALRLAENCRLKHRIYVATCVPHDEEMRYRVERHQAERSHRWSTVEEPIRLADVIRDKSAADTVVLVDCLTLWVTNLVMAAADRNPEHFRAPTRQLVESLEESEGPVVLVSNEVGTGIVPENPMARLFRDIAGSVNQGVASVSDTVVWMVAGIPVRVKPPQ